MEASNKKLSIFLAVLRVIETVYLLSFFFILYAYHAPWSESIAALTNDWILISYMLLPVLLFKNLLVAIYNNGALKSWQKTYILVRCLVYVLLTFYSYPLIASL